MRILLCGLFYGFYSLLRSFAYYIQPEPLSIPKDFIIVNGMIIAMGIYMINAGHLKRWYGYLLSEIILVELLARYFDYRPLLWVKAVLAIVLMVGAVVDFFRTRKEQAAEEADAEPL